MPGHSKRWCTYSIEYDNWSKTFAREVSNDPQINAFKKDCVTYFHNAYPGVDISDARTVFNDGFQNPPNAKLI